MKKICIIPARGGSKRIPRKNIKLFLGKPIIAYSITAALESNLFDEVMVSTDDKEIAKEAILYGANVPFMRSNKNSDDHASTRDVIYEVINNYENLGERFDYICCLYPTAPLVTSKSLIEGFKIILKNTYFVVFPIIKYNHPIKRAYFFENNSLKLVFPENRNYRTQDIDAYYFDAGQFYWIDKEALNSESPLFSKKLFGITISSLDAQDIDCIEDWTLAEMKYKNRNL